VSKIQLSKLAKKVIHQSIRESNIPKNEGLRLEEAGGVLSLTTDIPKKGDRIIKRDGNIVLIIHRSLEEKMGGAYIDIKILRGEPKLVVVGEKDANKIEIEHTDNISF